jgi:cell division protein FtsI/penicillin-binding protein 2
VTTSSQRIGVLFVLFAAGVGVVLVHLGMLMVRDQEVWAKRSHENRWAFRSVPGQRGSLFDRHGRLLVYDEPTTELSIYYRRFRQQHPVGAAVHAATRYVGTLPGREGTTFQYQPGVLDPRAAVRELLSMPCRALLPGNLPKAVASEVGYALTTVLAECSGLPRRRVYSAVRQAGRTDGAVQVGDVLPVGREKLIEAFERRLRSLHELEARVLYEQAHWAQQTGGRIASNVGLVEQLDLLRRFSLAEERVQWSKVVPESDDSAEDGKDTVTQRGGLIETVQREFARGVSFELAASLRVGRAEHPGIEVQPSVARVRTPAADGTLGRLVGEVQNLDRVEPDGKWIERYIARELEGDWLQDLVPEGVDANGVSRFRLEDDARRRYEQHLRLRERRGLSGLEFACNGELTGRLGMRFVEHDRGHREQRLWGNLRAEQGVGVATTVDVDLQRLAEAAVARSRQRYVAAELDPDMQRHCRAAIALIDARTGDVLAYAGSPIDDKMPIPGLRWTGNGAIGSVVKPFVLLEQLLREEVGAECRPSAEMQGCQGHLDYAGMRLRCDHQHWDGGRDPVTALAQSCNSFFYQAGLGMGSDGLAAAMQRFGLAKAAEGDHRHAACWQPVIRGAWVADPRVNLSTIVPQRAIGYGCEASPLNVARAYAGLATGVLPTLSFVLGEARPGVSLGAIDQALEVVRRGLVECVRSGTARRITTLRELEVAGKTGTAEVSSQGHNNAWFAGYLPAPSATGVQLCFCAVVYRVPDKVHGAAAAGELVAEVLDGLRGAPEFAHRYLPGGGR